MVWRGEKPSLREASCCRVEVVKGGGGLRRCGFVSILATVKLPPRARPSRRRAVVSSGMSSLSSFLPSKPTSRADEGLALGGRELGHDRPVFLRLEHLDLGLAVADQAERHRLHAAGRAGAGQLAPQHRREREADQIVERAAGEIGVDQRAVDLARMAHGLEHGVLGDGVEDDALDRDRPSRAFLRLSTSSTCQEMASPSRSGSVARMSWSAPLSALAISARRLADLGSTSQCIAKSLSGLDRAVLGGQVADMAIGGEHLIAGPEILVDGLGLGRRFDDDDVHETVLGCARNASGCRMAVAYLPSYTAKMVTSGRCQFAPASN